MNKAWRFQWLFIHFFSCESKACKLTICNIQFILFSICLYTPHSFLIFYVGDSPSQENPGMSTVGVRARSKFLQSKYDHITENVNIQWSVRKEYFLPLHDNLLKKGNVNSRFSIFIFGMFTILPYSSAYTIVYRYQSQVMWFLSHNLWNYKSKKIVFFFIL